MAKKKEIEPQENTIVDKEKIESEIKKEVKEQLLDELEKHVELKVENKLDKMEKRIFKQKQGVIFKKNIIIILLLALVIFEGKVLYDNGLLDKNKVINNTKNDNISNNEVTDVVDKEEKPEKIVKDSAWYIENYGYLISNIKTNLTNEDKYYLYQDNYTVDKIKNTVKLNMAYQLLSESDINDGNGFITVDSNKLEGVYKNLFNDQYIPENFSNSCIQFIYNASLNKYLAISMECPINNIEVVQSIKEVKEIDSKIVITTVLGLYNKEKEVLTDIDGLTTLKYKENLLEYQDKLPNYKYTFKNIDGKYYLESINK